MIVERNACKIETKHRLMEHKHIYLKQFLRRAIDKSSAK